MIKFLVFFIFGILAGKGLELDSEKRKIIQILQSGAVLSILFIMGISLGQNKELVSNIGSIGFKSIVFSLSSIFFSILLVFLYEKYIYSRRRDSDD
ncbi:MAG: LysO family transporter [Tissierellia bacterium]|nr:LysO family transporter [Tissierellia bacterium]